MEKSDSAVSGDIRFLGDLQRLELRPGDRFVLTIPRILSIEHVESIQSAWRRFMGGDAAPELLLLDGGMKLDVIRGPSGES